jgi:addiction module HigA family antidote
MKMVTLMTLKSLIITKGDTDMTKNGLPAIHPGEFLDEILGEMGLSQAEFARTIGVSPMRISHVIKGDRKVSAELALLFGRAFNQTPQYWLNLQASYDLKIVKASIGKRLAGIHALVHA